MDPFTAGILVTCGLIAINLLVLAAIEQSHRRGLAAAAGYEDGGANRPGSSISTKTEDTDDPTRRLIKPQDKVRNYTDLQNSLDTRLHSIMNGLSYNILSSENPTDTSEMPQSPLDTSNSYTSSLGADESATKELPIGECISSSPDINISDNNPDDTTQSDATPTNLTQTDTKPQDTSLSDTSPPNPTESDTSRQDTATCDTRQPDSTERTSSTPDPNLSNSGSADTTIASHSGLPSATKNRKRKPNHQ